MEKPEKISLGSLVLVPCPSQGHLTPMLQLAAILHSKGFSITIAHTKFNSPDPRNHPAFTFLPIPDDFSAAEAASMNFIRAVNDSLETHLQRILTEHLVRQEHQSDRIVCIIYDAYMYKTDSVANLLKVPTIILRTTCASLSLVHAAYPRLQSQGFFPFKDSMSHELVPGLHPLRFKDLPIFNVPELDNLLQLIGDTTDIRTSSAIIWNTMECLEQPSLQKIHQYFQIPCFAIGPIHKIVPTASGSLLEENKDCIPWLDKQAENSVIYVSFGSVASIKGQELIEIAWGLANSENPFLWVVRAGSVRYSDWIALLPDSLKEKITKGGGCIVKWAPQKEVLAHAAVGGFLSHCGWNSVVESISAGVPMICRPIFGDQKLNARYVSCVWRVGIALEELERGEIEQAVRKLMVDEDGEEMRQRAIGFKTETELGLKSTGSSHKSLNDLVQFLMSL